MSRIRKDLKTCCEPGFPYYRCEYETVCELGEKPEHCAWDFMHRLREEGMDLDALDRDCREEGYTIFGIEAHAVLLSQKSDMDVEGDGNSVGSWMKIREGNVLKPLGFEIEPARPYQFRASEFGHKCQISALISKLDWRYRFQFPDSVLSRVGTVAHELCNGQAFDDYPYNRTLEMIGVEPANRCLYCENRLESVVDGYTIRGKADGLMTLGELPVIFDFKRALAGTVEAKSRKFQLLSYLFALGTDKGFLITTKRPFPPGKRDSQRFPRYNMTMVGPQLIDEFKHELDLRYDYQRRLVENPGFLLSEIKNMREKGSCNKGFPCFSQEICNDLYEKIMEGGLALYLDKDLELT